MSMKGTATDERIAQWEKMTRESPDDMSWFSLGSAYQDAGRYQDAVDAFMRAIALNPDLSRAYQLLGQVLIKLDRNREAAEILTSGYRIAAGRGDVMPQRAMQSLLEKLGAALPEIENQQQAEPADGDENTITDRRTGRLQRRLDGPPMRGPVGTFIYQNFGQETWQQWIRQGTKVINELRLDFSQLEHQDVYEQYMLEWLGVSRDEIHDQ